MRGAATLFRIWGIPVRVHVNWLVILGLLTWSLSVGYFPRVVPDLPHAAYWTKGFLAALLLFGSVFLHELSHAVAARAYGIPVSNITLHIFGGVSQLEREPHRPGVEFAVAIVGPLTSFSLAVVLALATPRFPLSPAVAATVTYLILVNVIIGIFNLVPGFPLDGGRLLRAALWKLKGNLQWATRIATRTGFVVAFVLMGLGMLRILSGAFLGGLWLVLIGYFLRQAARGCYQQLVLRQVLGAYAVRDVMIRDVVHISADLSVTRAVDEFFWPCRVMGFPVLNRGQVVGILDIHQIHQLPRERWPEARVQELMHPLDETLRTEPEAPLWEAFDKLLRNGLGRLVVLDGERLVGSLSAKDIIEIMATAFPTVDMQSVTRDLARLSSALSPRNTASTN